jgi:hypothetical protein
VPAGAICLTQHGKGVGTPFFDDASPAFQAALTKFDFAGGGSESLQTILKESRSYDTLTLWHLLSRVSPDERAKIFDALAAFVKLPKSVTREGVLRLDKRMLERGARTLKASGLNKRIRKRIQMSKDRKELFYSVFIYG